MINTYASYYTNNNFYAEYGRDSEGIPSMSLVGAIDADGNTSVEPREEYYPGSVETVLAMVYFRGTLNIYPHKRGDSVDVPIECEGEEAIALLELFGWEPEEYEWSSCGDECDTAD